MEIPVGAIVDASQGREADRRQYGNAGYSVEGGLGSAEHGSS